MRGAEHEEGWYGTGRPEQGRADQGADGTDWDVAVVGAGPAGSVAALAAVRARPDARVLLLDRSDFPRDKSCGDGVAPQVFDVLARLGAHDVLAGLPGLAPVHRLRLGLPGGAQADGRMRRPAFVVPRRVLDARLVELAVAAGAHLRRQRVRQVRPAGPGGGLDLGQGTRARVVIGADGAQSVVRAALGLPRPRERDLAIAIRGYAPVTADRADRQVIAFSPHGPWPAYAWSFPIGDGRANIGYGEGLAMAGRGPRPPDRTTRSQMIARIGDLLPGALDGAGDWRGHHLPLSTGRARQPDGPVLLAGDALGLINPLTGEGIHAAVLSGALAGLAAAGAGRDAVAARPPGAVYRAALRAAFGRHMLHLSLAARLGHRASGLVRDRRRLVGAGLRAADGDQGVFDDLVEMGLADGGVTPRVVLAVARSFAHRAPLRHSIMN